LLALRALAVEQERARRAAGDQELALLQQLDSLKLVLAKLADDPSASQRQRMRTKSSIDALTQKLSILRRQTGSASDSLWLDRFLNNPRSLSEFQKSLAEQKAVALIYLVGANTTVAFALHPDTLLARLVRTFERDTLRAVVKRLSPLLGLERSQPSNPAVQSPLQLDLKRSMARALVQTLVDSLLLDRRPEKLIIMPDDALCTLPFDALMRVASGSNVSLDALPRIQIAFDFEDIFPLSPMNSARALIMANSQRVQNNDAGIKPPKLKFAVREAKEIAGLLDGSADLLYDEHATRDSFLVKAPHYDILHLPMHASLSDWSSEYAQMSFGAANGGSAPMYGYEISHMSLQARLAVLSACNTALGDFRPGFGLLSLVLNFVDAGVPAVVATLWQVDEKSTKILMVEFYKQVRNGNWFSEALAGAKQHLIENGYSHPYYWAGFVLYGKDGKVDSMASPPAAAISWWSWWPIFFVLMVVGALLWLWQRQRLGRLRKSNGTMGSETV
jgi:CHAT domain-containing protein